MAARPRQADDLDFLLLDALRDVASAATASPGVWAALRGRIMAAVAAAPPPVTPKPPIAAAAPEWTLNRHLMSLARQVC